jgi:hypothetical protein
VVQRDDAAEPQADLLLVVDHPGVAAAGGQAVTAASRAAVRRVAAEAVVADAPIDRPGATLSFYIVTVCHWLSFARHLHSHLAVMAVTCIEMTVPPLA